MNHARNLAVLLIVLVAIGAAVIVYWQQPQGVAVVEPAMNGTPADDDDLGEVTNHRPVASPAQPTLVGRQVCKECHSGNYDLHAKHGHASTFARTRDTDIAKRFVGKTFDSGEPYGSFTYHADGGELFARLPERFGDKPFPLQFALGSGHNAVTFLSLIPDITGGTAAIEHRVSWYSAEDQLNLTPGHSKKTPEIEVEYFGDTARGQPLQQCISCHTTSAKIVGQDLVDLIPNVNCEKCHGPGSEHVRQARSQQEPPPYSVGHDDWDTESELQLCGSCHRMPINVSLKELRDYPDMLTRFQPIGMLRSRCYLESEGKMRCTTCHSPHTAISTVTEADHVQNCVNCHLEDSDVHVACPVSPQEGCMECHMPGLKQEEGLAFHDHWIRVRDDR